MSNQFERTGHSAVCTGALNLIDLAGSERLSRSLAQGDRLKETQNINKSLSALGAVDGFPSCTPSRSDSPSPAQGVHLVGVESTVLCMWSVGPH
jgi:hypothetical protein